MIKNLYKTGNAVDDIYTNLAGVPYPVSAAVGGNGPQPEPANKTLVITGYMNEWDTPQITAELQYGEPLSSDYHYIIEKTPLTSSDDAFSIWMTPDPEDNTKLIYNVHSENHIFDADYFTAWDGVIDCGAEDRFYRMLKVSPWTTEDMPEETLEFQYIPIESNL